MLSFKKQKIICTVGPLYLWFPVPGFNPKQLVCCWLNLWMRNLRILSANCIHFTVPFVSGVWAAGPLVSMGTPRINDQEGPLFPVLSRALLEEARIQCKVSVYGDAVTHFP